MALALAFACTGCIVVFPLDSPTDATDQCPTSYTQHSTGSYRFESIQSTWLVAAATCRDERVVDSSRFTHLAVLSNDSERDVVIATLGGQAAEVWVGLTDQGHEADFRWITDEDAEMSPHYPGANMAPPWQVGEPSNTNNREDCVALLNSGELNDFPCADDPYMLAFVCECDDHDPAF